MMNYKVHATSKPLFEIKDLDGTHLNSMTLHHVYTSDAPFAWWRLKLLTLSYYDFKGEVHNDGKMMVLDAAAPHVINIFKDLYDLKFPLQSIRLMDDFDGDDQASMDANNTSCFNYRQIANSDKISLHGYGLAIDINPIQNPCLKPNKSTGMVTCQPKLGIDYLNRDESRPDKPNRPGIITPKIVQIFKSNGFTVWGGQWDDPVDYMHFQIRDDIKNALLRTADILDDPRNQSTKFFENYVKFHLSSDRLRYFGSNGFEQSIKLMLQDFEKDPNAFITQLSHN